MLLKVKLVNQLRPMLGFGYEVEIQNIKINGAYRGCSGFIRNPTNGVTVYINTEKSCYAPLNKMNLVRFAKDMKDYGGVHSRNEWADDASIAKKIVNMLHNKIRYDEWLKCNSKLK